MNNPFFIVGTGRNGSQMLSKMLGYWPEVVVLPETHFLVTLFDKYGNNKITAIEFLAVVDDFYGSHGDKWVNVILRHANKEIENYKEGFVSFAKNKANIKEMTINFYTYLYGKNKIFGDKTPGYGSNLNILTKIWGDIKIIYLVRDGVDCALSMLQHPAFVLNINGKVRPEDTDRIMYKGQQLKFSKNKPKLEDSLFYWKNGVDAATKELAKIDPNNVLKVRYEDLIFNSRSELDRICKFLSLDSNNLYFKKAYLYPRAFPEISHYRKLSDKDYKNYYSRVENTMKELDYPYNINLDISFKRVVNECLRWSASKILNFYENIQRIINKFRRL